MYRCKSVGSIFFRFILPLNEHTLSFFIIYSDVRVTWHCLKARQYAYQVNRQSRIFSLSLDVSLIDCTYGK